MDKLVTAIMPTRGRGKWALQALDCFLKQTYINKELVIIDDTDEPSFPGGVKHPLVRYFSNNDRRNIAAKRNQAAQLSVGEIICHMDSDDYSASIRIEEQAERLLASGLAVTGYRDMIFYDEEGRRAFKYHGIGNYALGTSLMYFRSWLEKHPFPEHLVIGEDNELVFGAAREKQLIVADAEDLMIARIHPANTSKKDLTGDNYKPVDVVKLAREFFEWKPEN